MSGATSEVLERRRVNGSGSLKAFAKVKLECVAIHSCRVIQQDGQRAWVARPQIPARAKADGSGGGWFSAVELSNKQVLDRLRDAVITAWQERVPLPERGRRARR